MMMVTYTMLAMLFIATFFSILSIHRDVKLFITVTKFLTALTLLLLLVVGYFSIISINGVYKIHISTFFYLIIAFLMILLLYMAFSRWSNDFRSISAILLPIATVLSGLSLLFINSPRYMIVEPGNSFILFHIILALLGEVLFFVAFASSVLYVIMSWQLQKKSSMKFINRFPSLNVLSKLILFSLFYSLVFFSTGIIFGIAMLYELHGNISAKTPKEILMYGAWGILLLLWLTGKTRLTTTYYLSIMTILSFAILLTLFIAGNVVITSGFHSFR